VSASHEAGLDRRRMPRNIIELLGVIGVFADARNYFLRIRVVLDNARLLLLEEAVVRLVLV